MEFCSSRQNHSRPNSLDFRELWFSREEQNSEFPRTFFGGYLFVFVKNLSNRSPKIKTKNIKNYSSILVIANHRNWLDDSLPLIPGPISTVLQTNRHWSNIASFYINHRVIR